MVALALFQPDIHQNVGTVLRMGACLSVPIHIVMPCGFPWDLKKLKRSGMDYLEKVELEKHESWEVLRKKQMGRIILLSTKARQSYIDVDYRATDILLLGQESAGVPQRIADESDVVVKIPMMEGVRSLNVAIAGAMVLSEALRQTTGLTVKEG